MENIPKKIYLQITDDANEFEEDFNELQGISWCIDKINDTDIEYTLSSQLPQKLDNDLLADVSNRRELLIAFAEWIFKKTKGLSVIKRMVDRYLSNS